MFWTVLDKTHDQNLFWEGWFKPVQNYGLNRPCPKCANPLLYIQFVYTSDIKNSQQELFPVPT